MTEAGCPPQGLGLAGPREQRLGVLGTEHPLLGIVDDDDEAWGDGGHRGIDPLGLDRRHVHPCTAECQEQHLPPPGREPAREADAGRAGEIPPGRGGHRHHPRHRAAPTGGEERRHTAQADAEGHDGQLGGEGLRGGHGSGDVPRLLRPHGAATTGAAVTAEVEGQDVRPRRQLGHEPVDLAAPGPVGEAVHHDQRGDGVVGSGDPDRGQRGAIRRPQPQGGRGCPVARRQRVAAGPPRDAAGEHRRRAGHVRMVSRAIRTPRRHAAHRRRPR